jgi:membrane protease YdiL (CAAX protease family)
MLAIIVGSVSRYIGEPADMPLQNMLRTRGSVILLTILGVIVAPFAEETVFRGCVYPVIARRWGTELGIIGTGALFGLVHSQQLGGAWAQVTLLVVVGMILTYIRARTGSVVAGYLVHLGYNSILFVGFYVATSGLRNLPGPS